MARNKSKLPLALAAAVALCLAAAAVLLPPGKGRTGDTAAAASAAAAADTKPTAEAPASTNTAETQEIEAGGSLVIPIAEVSETARFYPIEVDGTRMEILAVKDSLGNIRTAFNTCQICYSSGRGYYVQEGEVLVCQNCGNRFTVDHVEIESGGCNPWPVFAENKTVTEDEITISYDYLKECEAIFANWKTGG